MLICSKISFKTEKDKKLVTLFTKPKEFGDYVHSNYVANGMVVTSCLNDILKLPNVTNETESLNNCNVTIKMLEMFLDFELEFYITDQLIDKLLVKNFIPKHIEEFESAWAMKLVRLRVGAPTRLIKRINLDQPTPELSGQLGVALGNSRPSNTRESSLAPSENLTNDETTTSKTLEGTLIERRTFFYAFLVQKQSQLQHCLAKKTETLQLTKMLNQNTNKNQQRKNNSKFKENKALMGHTQDASSSKTFNAKDQCFKPRPIKCDKKTHKQGSLYFCSTFRQKSLKEKKCSSFKTWTLSHVFAKTTHW